MDIEDKVFLGMMIIIAAFIGIILFVLIPNYIKGEANIQERHKICERFDGVFVRNAYKTGKYTHHTAGVCFHKDAIINLD